ncbi:MAG: autotransporter domain-containing protein [Spirochaetes bacterium]|nr:autotransporter domain-containing protein [Spirochaetota bacterium]
MKRAFLLVLIFAMITIAGGAVFADDEDFASMQKNAVTVDIGPLIVSNSYRNFFETSGTDAPSFGIAAQYERQLMEKLSLAARFAYMTFGMSSSNDKKKSTEETSSFSLEGHVRLYPGDVFFVDGMLGYANVSVTRKVIEKTPLDDIKPMNYSISRNYFKYGIKIGWRVSVGKPVGFVFEPSFGWNGGIGLGETLGKQEAKKEGKENDSNAGWSLVEQWIFVGGPRLSLAFGVRF